MLRRMLLALLLLCLLTGAACASELVSGDYTFQVAEDGSATILSYTGSEAAVTVPAEMEGYPVGSIGDSAFYACIDLVEVTIPDTIAHLGVNPFACCDALERIIVSPAHPTLMTVDGLLMDRADMRIIAAPCALMTGEVTLPEGTRSVGDAAFMGCTALERIAMPYGVETLGEEAFSGCTALREAAFPQSLTAVGGGAFSCCEALERAVFPHSVREIGAYAFSGCSAMKHLSLPRSLIEVSEGSFEGCGRLRTIAIPENVAAIGKWAFRDCAMLGGVILPASVQTISDHAFEDCPVLTVTVPRDSYALQWAMANGVAYATY